jgi:hypothetical protein
MLVVGSIPTPGAMDNIDQIISDPELSLREKEKAIIAQLAHSFGMTAEELMDRMRSRINGEG